LRDFLLQQKAEVVKVSIYEYDEEREMKLIRADERALGEEIGRAEGMQQGRIDAVQRMIRKGCTKEFILDLGYTEEEYAEAEAELCQMA